MGEQQVEYGAIETGICPLMSSDDTARKEVSNKIVPRY